MIAAHRTIVVMRHARAEQVAATDFDRELVVRGRADAAVAGAWLAEQGVAPDAALVSEATRTRQTWTALAAGAGWELEPTVDGGLYAADPDTALDLVRALADDVATVVVVGHNPTMAYLAALLDDGEGDPHAAAALATGGFPTSSVAVFTHTGPWPTLDAGAARLSAYFVGRG